MRLKRIKDVVFCGVLAGTALLGASAFSRAGLKINITGSLPRGLYMRTAARDGLVEFCPTDNNRSAVRGYRDYFPGDCPDGQIPLLKPVVARAGDNVDVSREGIRVNGSLIANSAARTVDSAGRPLTPYPSGEYRVAPGELWVIGSYDARSYDSRYFGPIQSSLVRERLKPFLVWR